VTGTLLCVGLVLVSAGIVALLDVARVNERLASISSPRPRWNRNPAAYRWASAAYYRCVGALFVAMGAFLLGAGLRA
jgi:hypothetical protein